MKSVLLDYKLHCSCFISFPSVHSPSHSFHYHSTSHSHLPYLAISFISFTIVHLIHIYHIWLFGFTHTASSLNLIIVTYFSANSSLEINGLGYSETYDDIKTFMQ